MIKNNKQKADAKHIFIGIGGLLGMIIFALICVLIVIFLPIKIGELIIPGMQDVSPAPEEYWFIGMAAIAGTAIALIFIWVITKKYKKILNELADLGYDFEKTIKRKRNKK